MATIVSGTGISGFMSSFILLKLGMGSMGCRYAISVLVAYLVFLFLLYVWLQIHRGDGPDIEPDDLEDVVDLIELSTDADSDITSVTPPADGGSPPSVEPSGSKGTLGNDVNFDDAVVVIAILAMVFAALGASLYIVYSAPVLLAEVFVDGVLSAGLYRSLRKAERRHWIESTFLRTRFPILVVLLFFTVAGFAMDKYATGSDSIGGVFEEIMDRE